MAEISDFVDFLDGMAPTSCRERNLRAG